MIWLHNPNKAPHHPLIKMAHRPKRSLGACQKQKAIDILGQNVVIVIVTKVATNKRAPIYGHII